ncbi:hypothetical protein BKA82DRAFT_132175 [Pisolithus tinctorius]|uniref:Uncharacterized protein n=1 Tax=Pisolithus tinctorius Marx 270 TaxID=870435 RepID=A0A0C3P742_PISTI|nr:hypothetical protein BKA82DRAFT_132175 [Pisolithus tinctorius]KIO09195.1 hypothetical protein M404DRAFT_132175 [Pisolithus tinctorius Marx 270]
MQSFEFIQFYPIPTRPLSEILQNPSYRSFDLHQSESYPGKLGVDHTPGPFIGIGRFKTAQSGSLMLTPPSPSGLGSKPYHDVVVKRPFISPPTLTLASGTKATCGVAGKHSPKSERRRIICLSLGDELPKLHCEANMLYWAKALLVMTYKFIYSAISSAEHPPPFEIPKLCFVEAGLALTHSQHQQIISLLNRA